MKMLKYIVVFLFLLGTGLLQAQVKFEAKVSKKVILHDQSINLILKENQVQSVDGVNGPSLKIGSMNEINTNGNWPKNYSKDN